MMVLGIYRGVLHQGEDEERTIHCHFSQEQHGMSTS